MAVEVCRLPVALIVALIVAKSVAIPTLIAVQREPPEFNVRKDCQKITNESTLHLRPTSSNSSARKCAGSGHSKLRLHHNDGPLPRTRNVTVLPVPNAHLAHTSEGRRAETPHIRLTSAKRHTHTRSTEVRALAHHVSTSCIFGYARLKGYHAGGSYSDLHMLRPPPPWAETSPSPSLPRKPATVYALSHTTHLAYIRLAHAHPYIHQHRSTDFHTFRPPPIYWHVHRTFHLDLVQLPLPSRLLPTARYGVGEIE
ncbi:hypothetical protein B0H14DRAFT_2646509 [Mycena olivaceomarginata]|nr:hypothetical protein B0H14DRAFT_2646509 [Mycena olivaceomarginata]